MFAGTDDGNESEFTNYTSTSTTSGWSEPCRCFEFHELVSATNNFDESLVIGRGGSAKVYKGNLVNGSSRMVFAVKRLDSESSRKASEFRAELETLSNLHNTQIVSLIGYCHHEEDMILVFEYFPNGTLHEHLHRVRTRLSWLQRLKICIGVARALNYLHIGTGTDFIIHRDINSSNILLNKSFAPKVMDFGLSKIVAGDQKKRDYVDTDIKGTFGYLDPKYIFTGKLSTKSDVYSFGVVLFEVLFRKMAVELCNLAIWALDSIKDGRLKHIIDSDIRDEISPKCLKGFVHITERCLDQLQKHRPTMAKVLSTLESILDLQEKTNSSLQAAGKTIFGRQTNAFSVPKNSGIPFFSLMCLSRPRL